MEQPLTPKDMTIQAHNFISLCRGNAPSVVHRALKSVSKSVLNELLQHYDASNIDDLTFKISKQ